MTHGGADYPRAKLHPYTHEERCAMHAPGLVNTSFVALVAESKGDE